VPLEDDLRRVADAAIRYADGEEELAGIVPTEPGGGSRGYLCAYRAADGTTTWLVLDDDTHAVESRARVREVVSIAALCELAEELAAGGDLDELRSQLVALRVTESPPGIEEAEQAALDLQAALGAPPRLASPSYLDTVGAATRRLEEALGDGGSPFAVAMKQAFTTVDELTRDVEAHYKRALN
jgi:hypothetical protein